MAKITKKCFAVKIDAGHTPSGNPQRGWALYDREGYYLGFVDEGYRGRRALKEVASNCVELGAIPTTKSAYRMFMDEEIGSKPKRRRSRKNPKGLSRKKVGLSGRKKSRTRGRKAKSKARSRKPRGAKAWSRAAIKAAKSRRRNKKGQFVKSRSKAKSRAKAQSRKGRSRKGRSRRKGRSKARSKATSRTTKRIAIGGGRGYRYMVDGRFATKAEYDRAKK